MGRTLGSQLFVRVHIFFPPTRPPTDTSPRRNRNISICETLRSEVHPELVHESIARSSKAVRGSDPCFRSRAITSRWRRSFFLIHLCIRPHRDAGSKPCRIFRVRTSWSGRSEVGRMNEIVSYSALLVHI